MKVTGLISEQAEIKIEDIRQKVRERQIQLGAFVKDLDIEEVGIVTNVDAEAKKFSIEFIKSNETNTYDFTSDAYQLATEEEVVKTYYRQSLLENDTEVKKVYDMKYVFIGKIQAVGEVIHAVNEEIVLVKYLFKLKTPTIIEENTNMNGFFPRTGKLNIKKEEWREATSQELELYKKKVQEAYEKAFPKAYQ